MLAVTKPGEYVPSDVAAAADLRTDCPLYTVWRDGVPTEQVADVTGVTQTLFTNLCSQLFLWSNHRERGPQVIAF